MSDELYEVKRIVGYKAVFTEQVKNRKGIAGVVKTEQPAWNVEWLGYEYEDEWGWEKTAGYGR